ncbi:MAG: hypothetical protein GEU75_04800 [Dehalococcoidia bacterium]|nr:hypothetical protein [Dehalococcoidia bacterium]
MMRFSLPRFGERLRGSVALLGLTAVLAGVIILYSPTLDDPFHGDDYVAFTEFKSKSILTYSEDVLLFQDSNYYWRPLGKIFHRVLYEVAGLDALVFRLTALGVFLATLVALYAFCVRERLGTPVALASVFILGVLPNHVVSVAWVTNTSRLMAVLFFLLCLLLLQRPGRHRLLYEAAAVLCFVAAVLSDETALALAPVPVLYAGLVADKQIRWRSLLARGLAYGFLVAVLIPMQFSNTLDDEARLSVYGLGTHVVTQGWALVSQLVLPLTPPEPWEVMLDSIRPLQWGAGLAAIAAGALLFAVGSARMRWLLLWTALSLSPFCLWGVLYTSPRYVYMAAVPYSVILAWLSVELFGVLRRVAAERVSTALLVPLSRVAVAGAAGLVLLPSASMLMSRNDLWSQHTEDWGTLAMELRREAPEPASGSRIVLFYGTWSDTWARAAVWTIYGDHSLTVQVIPPYRLDVEYGPFTEKDFVFYKVGDQLLPSTVYGARR